MHVGLGHVGNVPKHSKRLQIAAKVNEIAKELGVEPAQVAIQWTRQGKNKIVPIIGARTASQFKTNLGLLSIVIPENKIQELNEISAIELGFPHDFLKSESVKSIIYSDTFNQIKM